MKRFVFLICIFCIVLSSTACNGNFSQTDLNTPVLIPENGIVEKSVFEEIKNNNLIATFIGKSNELEYKWIIFGRDITAPKDSNLLVKIEKSEDGIILYFSETEAYGFTALLSVYLDEKWNSGSVTAYCNGEASASVSITGSKTSILNLSVEKVIDRCEIFPNSSQDETESSAESESTDISDNSFFSSGDEATSQEVSSLSEETSAENEEENASTSNSTPMDSDESQSNEPSQNEPEASKRPVSDGKDTSKDKYETDPVPEGKPLPVEPEIQEIDKEKIFTCTFSIECSTILNNLSQLDPEKLELIPTDGVILPPMEVTFHEGESVFDVLKRVCMENNVHLEFSWTPIYNSAYIEGINNLYEFDCGPLSGWMYRVNGWYPNYGCSRYQLDDGEVVEWRFTCDLGRDVGEDNLG